MSAAANWSYTATATIWKNLVISDCGEPVSLRQGIEYLMSIKRVEPQLGGFHDDPDDFFLRSP